jgi:hypothetical protein
MEFLCTLSGMNAVTRHVKIGICNWQWRGKTTSREADGIDSGLSWGLKNNQDWLFIKKNVWNGENIQISSSGLGATKMDQIGIL